MVNIPQYQTNSYDAMFRLERLINKIFINKSNNIRMDCSLDQSPYMFGSHPSEFWKSISYVQYCENIGQFSCKLTISSRTQHIIYSESLGKNMYSQKTRYE